MIVYNIIELKAIIRKIVRTLSLTSILKDNDYIFIN